VPDQPHSPPPERRPLLRGLVGDVDDFLEHRWERDQILSRGTSPRAGHFAELLSADDLVELVATRGLRHPFFRLIRAGDTPDRSSYLRSAGVGHTTVHDLGEVGRITEEVWAGASLVGQGLQRLWPPLTAFCDALADELGHRIQANAYLSPPDSHGFDLHYDTHDVFVLQVEGHKEWTVHAPADVLPHRRPPGADRPPAYGSPLWTGVLEPGDCRYLPRGFGHSARTSDGRSLHLTIGVLVTTWRSVLRTLADLLPDDDVELRRALPIGALTGDDEAFRAGWKAFGDHLGASIQAVDPDTVLARVRRDLWAGHPGSDADTLARAFTGAQPEAEDRLSLVPRVVEHHRVDGDGAAVQLVLRDRTISLPGLAGALVQDLLAGSAVRATDQPGGLDEASALVVLRRLYREGVVTIAGPATP
jgi:hypothetical protein